MNFDVTLINYNHGTKISRMISSICNNTILPTKLIIVDDGSNDNSKQEIEKFASKHSFIKPYFFSKNRGSFAAGKFARSKVTSSYFACTSSDDYVESDYFENALQYAKIYPQAGIIFGNMSIINEVNEITYIAKASKLKSGSFTTPQAFMDDYLMHEKITHCQSSANLYRSEAFFYFGDFHNELYGIRDNIHTKTIGLKFGVVYLNKIFYNWYQGNKTTSGKYNNDFTKRKKASTKAYELMSNDYKDLYTENFANKWRNEYLNSF